MLKLYFWFTYQIFCIFNMCNCDKCFCYAFVYKHAVTIKRAYARTSWATGMMPLYSWRTIGHESQTVFGMGLVRRPDVAIVDIRGRIVFC